MGACRAGALRCEHQCCHAVLVASVDCVWERGAEVVDAVCARVRGGQVQWRGEVCVETGSGRAVSVVAGY